VGLYDRFELLEMRHNDGVQTYHAREIATARPVQVHFLSNPVENSALLASVDRLPESERRRVLDQGEIQGIPYVVTDRLSGYATFREWLAAQAPTSAKAEVDTQFWTLFDAGQASAGHVSAAPVFEKPAEAPAQGAVYLEKEAEPWCLESSRRYCFWYSRWRSSRSARIKAALITRARLKHCDKLGVIPDGANRALPNSRRIGAWGDGHRV
jgi:hypothetical protein